MAEPAWIRPRHRSRPQHQVNAMTPITTREAIRIAIGELAAQCEAFEPSCVRCQAAALLCEQYGFKMQEFFVEVAE